MKRETHILLVDNGSYKPEAVLNLRNVAKKLSLKSSKVINPVSLLHSNKISDSKLNNIPADVFEPYVSEKVKNGTNEFLILPLFFGRSAAIYEYLPQRMEDIQQECGQFDLKIAPPLVDLDDANNDDVAQILADLVREEISYNKLDFPSVTLVDHGTPRIKVNEVRNFIAEQLALILKDEVQCVRPSSMESREGEVRNIVLINRSLRKFLVLLNLNGMLSFQCFLYLLADMQVKEGILIKFVQNQERSIQL